MNDKHIKRPTLILALIPIIVLIILLFTNIRIWQDNSISGPNQMALIFATFVAGIIGIVLNVKFKRMSKFMIKNISDSMSSILILLMIGALSGTWMLSGVVPTLIYYGMGILNPKIFLVATLIIASVVSLATGSSWSTVATVGVALLGIGTAQGFSPGLVAGALISGAYFGDKISPLSDTTNLAPAMAGTDIFTHIRYMLITTTPTYIITLLIFLLIGFFHVSSDNASEVLALQSSLKNTFNISPWLLLIPVILILLIVKKNPPLPALFFGALMGGIAAIIFQPDLIRTIDNHVHTFFGAAYRIIIQSFFGATSFDTGNANLSRLISTSGMKGMMDTIWLIITAMAFSGMMESVGLLIRIAESMVKLAKNTGSLVASVIFSSIFMNITASEQYISIVVPGRMYNKIFRRKGLRPELLSRSLEDGGTVTSVLVPWNTCGAINSTVLHVPTLSYLPYTFFNLISPLMSIFVASINYKIHRYTKEEMIVINEKDGNLWKKV
ncbi:MAG: Na+/H+ antiporter NhaC [Bacteroidetes bacterium CG2_30_33_31]|nr:MAG: Na+/H+ antiporter NhaC [Bacteroidetes bacterium CG2_30_33_31]